MLIYFWAKYWPAQSRRWLFIIESISYHLDVHGIKVPGSDVASKFTISVFALTKGRKMEMNPMENASDGLSMTWSARFQSHAPKISDHFLKCAVLLVGGQQRRIEAVCHSKLIQQYSSDNGTNAYQPYANIQTRFMNTGEDGRRLFSTEYAMEARDWSRNVHGNSGMSHK